MRNLWRKSEANKSRDNCDTLQGFQMAPGPCQAVGCRLTTLSSRLKRKMATSPSRRGAFNSLLSTTVTPIHTSTSRLLQVVLHSFQFDEIFFQYIVRFLFDLGFRHKGSSCIPPWRLRSAFNFLHSTMVTPIHTSIRLLQVVLHSFQFDEIFLMNC